MKYLDLFAGYGGFSLGIQKAYEICHANRGEKRGGEAYSQGEKRQGLQSEKGQDISSSERSACAGTSNIPDERPLCIGFSEVNEYAIKTYNKHFPKHKNYGDITKIDASKIEAFDLLVGGFPCQSFSIAGKRGGFEDTRGTLIFDVLRILKEKQPGFVLLENVKGLLSHDSGRTFKTIITALAELGYAVEWQVLNAKNFGVPQNRERVFIIGHLGGFRGRQVFPIGNDDESDKRQFTSNAITASYWKGIDNHGQRTHVQVKEATKKGYAVATEGDTINLSVLGSKTRRGRIGKGIAQTLDTGMQQHTIDNSKIRKLTPTECERLMGLPEGWTEGQSDTQRYKLCGNGVVVNVVEEIIKRLFL